MMTSKSFDQQIAGSRARRAASAAILFTSLALVGACGISYEKGEPGELIERGWKEFRLERWDEAERLYLSALHELDERDKTAPADEAKFRPLRSQANYALGLLWSLRRPGSDPAKARQYLASAVQADPKGETAGWARLAVVRDDHIPDRSDEKIDIPRLRKEYGEVASEFAGTAAGTEAFVFRMSLFVQTLDEDDARTAIREIDAFLPTLKTVNYKSPLYSLRTQAFSTLKDYPAALDSMIKTVETREINRNSPLTSNVADYYRIGMMALYDVGDIEIAKTYFKKLQQFPAEQKMFAVQRALELIDALEKNGGDFNAIGTIGIRPHGPGVGGLPGEPARADPGSGPVIGDD